MTQGVMDDWHAMSKVREAVPQYDSLTQQTCCTVLFVSRLDAVCIFSGLLSILLRPGLVSFTCFLAAICQLLSVSLTTSQLGSAFGVPYSSSPSVCTLNTAGGG